jgi:hypothetical protein
MPTMSAVEDLTFFRREFPLWKGKKPFRTKFRALALWERGAAFIRGSLPFV